MIKIDFAGIATVISAYISMLSSVDHATRVVCISSLDYELNADTAFHPSLFLAAQTRIYNTLMKTDSRTAFIVKRALGHSAAKRVWAIVVEEAGVPVYVIRNLTFIGTNYPYRRVLLVNCDDISEEAHMKSDYCEFIEVFMLTIASLIICANIIAALSA
jgi:hypothetical protein